MTGKDEGRRYSDQELGLILRKAMELDVRSPASSRGGLTIDDIRAIAAEVGLDPATIAQATALVPAVRESRLSRLLGGPESLTYEMQLEGELADEDRSAVIRSIRRVLNQHGETGTIGDIVEWKSVGRVNQVSVTIATRAGGTDVQILAERGPALMLSCFLPAVGWLALAGAIGGAVEPTGAAAIATLFGGAAVGAGVTARAIWSSGTRRLRDMLERLTAALRLEVATLTSESPAEPAGNEPADDSG